MDLQVMLLREAQGKPSSSIEMARWALEHRIKQVYFYPAPVRLQTIGITGLASSQILPEDEVTSFFEGIGEGTYRQAPRPSQPTPVAPTGLESRPAAPSGPNSRHVPPAGLNSRPGAPTTLESESVTPPRHGDLRVWWGWNTDDGYHEESYGVEDLEEAICELRDGPDEATDFGLEVFDAISGEWDEWMDENAKGIRELLDRPRMPSRRWYER